jgi:hypothetical protein
MEAKALRGRWSQGVLLAVVNFLVVSSFKILIFFNRKFKINFVIFFTEILFQRSTSIDMLVCILGVTSRKNFVLWALQNDSNITS